MLHDLGAEIKAQQPSAVPVVAPLKGEARAAFKTLDKYGGDYSRLTDLARMCAALPAARSVPDPPPAPTHLLICPPRVRPSAHAPTPAHPPHLS